MTDTEKKEVERIARKEIKDFMDSTQAANKVLAIIKKELRGKDIDEKAAEIAVKVVVELFRTLWQRKNFWESSLKNVR